MIHSFVTNLLNGVDYGLHLQDEWISNVFTWSNWCNIDRVYIFDIAFAYLEVKKNDNYTSLTKFKKFDAWKLPSKSSYPR